MTHTRLWSVSVLTFGIGDVFTTLFFISAGVNFEGNPLAAFVFQEYGLLWMLPWKVLVFGLFYAGYRIAPRNYRIGVPLGLSVIGVVISVWNVYSSVTGARILL